jgi:hypothetical protein
LENKRVQGAFGQTAIPYLPIRTEQRRGLTGRPTGGGAALTGGPVHSDGREVGQNGEEVKGISAPCSPCARVACGGGSTARSGRRRRLAAAAQLVAVVEQGRVEGARG